MKHKRPVIINDDIKANLVSKDLLNSYCIAEDEHYGTYKGVILGGVIRCSEVKIAVRILACIKPPSDKAIIYKDVPFHREPYAQGDIQAFSSKMVKCLVAETA